MDNRKLDRLIAKQFLSGWEFAGGDFRPTFDPAACSFVLEEIERRVYYYSVECMPQTDTCYRIRFMLPQNVGKTYLVTGERGQLWRAICEVAAKILEVEGE